MFAHTAPFPQKHMRASRRGGSEGPARGSSCGQAIELSDVVPLWRVTAATSADRAPQIGIPDEDSI